MYKVSYIGRKNFVKFDDKHYLLYLNEEQAEVKNEETGDAVQGYAYTGSQPDGGTLVEAKDVTDDNRRAKTPLPVSPEVREGNDVREARQRIAQLEAEQQQMMTRLHSQKAIASDPRRHEETPAPPKPAAPSGTDLAAAAMNLARLEGQIARNLEEYNKRPRKKFIGARVEEYRFAQYVEDWRLKVERVGNLNYPTAARGRHYGSLVLTVVIKSDGSLDRVEVNRPSGQKVLDDAARRIVEMAAPYPPFPDAIRRDTDILEITRTWSFTTSDRLQSD